MSDYSNDLPIIHRGEPLRDGRGKRVSGWPEPDEPALILDGGAQEYVRKCRERAKPCTSLGVDLVVEARLPDQDKVWMERAFPNGDFRHESILNRRQQMATPAKRAGHAWDIIRRRHGVEDADGALWRGRVALAYAHVGLDGLPVDEELSGSFRRRKVEFLLRLAKARDVGYYYKPSGSQYFPRLLSLYRSLGEPEDWKVFGERGFPSMLLEHLKPARYLHTSIEALYEVERFRLLLDLDLDLKNGWARTTYHPFAQRGGRANADAKTCIPYAGALSMAFIRPPPGHVVVVLDYSAQDMWNAATVTGDEVLLDALRRAQGRDIYDVLADELGLAHLERGLVKQLALGQLYGMMPETFCRRSGLDPDEALDLVDRFKTKYQRMFDRLAEMALSAAEGEVLRMDHFLRRKTSHKQKEYRGIRNAFVQARGAQQTYQAVLDLRELGFRVGATIHDAVVLVVPERSAVDDLLLAADTMERAAAAFGGEEVPVKIEKAAFHDAGSLMKAKWAAVYPHLGIDTPGRDLLDETRARDLVTRIEAARRGRRPSAPRFSFEPLSPS